MAYTIYTPVSNKILTSTSLADRINNQHVLAGTNPVLDLTDGIFFMEYLHVVSGQTAILKDGKGNTITTIVGDQTYQNNGGGPMRFDYGITVQGTVETIQGYVLRGVLSA